MWSISGYHSYNVVSEVEFLTTKLMIASSNPTAFFMSETVVQIHLGSAYLDQAIMSPSVST